jgi:hypothetical protein
LDHVHHHLSLAVINRIRETYIYIYIIEEEWAGDDKREDSWQAKKHSVLRSEVDKKGKNPFTLFPAPSILDNRNQAEEVEP